MSPPVEARTLAVFACTQTVLLTTLVLFVGTHGWDDGAITLAFSRTLAQTGRIALTPYSEEVEGFSSVSWLLLNAVPHLFGASFEAAIRTSQLLTVAALVSTTLVLSRVCENLRLTRWSTLFVLGAFILFGPCFSEAVNGMEMGLLALSGTYITYLLTGQERTPLSPRLIAAVAVFTTTRFEACFYIVFFALPLLVERRYALFVKIGVASAVTVFVLGVLRWQFFGELMPNTVLAKMHAPYSATGLRDLVLRIRAIAELPVLFIPPLTVTLISLVLPRKGSRLRDIVAVFDNRHLHLLCPLLGALAFSAITGLNWGYHGRMQFFAIPHALVLVGILVERLALLPGSGWSRRARATFVTGLASTVAAAMWFSFPFNSIAASRDGRFSVTPESFRATALRVDAVRQLLGETSLAFLTPDIGGAALCCTNLRIVDSALLANRRLARGGYQAFEELLADERPHVMETHGLWSQVTGIYEIGLFRASYYPAVIEQTRFYLREDVLRSLLQARVGCVRPIASNEQALMEHRYRDHTSREDDLNFARLGYVYHLAYGPGADPCGSG